MNDQERHPSRNGIGSGLHIGERPSTNNNQNGITTQRPNSPAPSKRGYA